MTTEFYIENLETLKDFLFFLDCFERDQTVKIFHLYIKIFNNITIVHSKINFRYVIGSSERLKNQLILLGSPKGICSSILK